MGARVAASVQTGPGAHEASYTMGTGSFQGLPPGKRPGRGADHPPPSSAEVEGRVELYVHLLPLWAFVACYRENFPCGINADSECETMQRVNAVTSEH